LKRQADFAERNNFMITENLRASSSPIRELAIEWWLRVLRISRRPAKRLRLCESLPLGEHRFVAVVEFDATRFLVGGTSSSLVLLSRLSDPSESTPSEPIPPEPDWPGTNPNKQRDETC
jgi:flagellar biogenesis protein FliO